MPPVLRLLGRFELVSGNDNALPIAGARAQLLMARLALADGDRMDRATLSAMLWGDRADAQARASLRQLIWTLRQALKPFPDAVVTDGDLVRLNPAVIKTDATQFDRLAQSPETGDLEAALTLFRGDLLESIDIHVLAPDGYFLVERARLRDKALKVSRTLVNFHESAANWEDSVRASRRGLAIDPFEDGLQAHLVGALQKLGRHREARDQDDAFRSRLQSELGVTATQHFKWVGNQHLAAPQPAANQNERATHAPPNPDVPASRSNVWPMVAGAAVVAAFLTLGLAVWRQDTGQFAVPHDAAHVATDPNRLPTGNLAAYDQYIRAEAERKAAKTDDQLRAVLATYRAAITLDPTFAAAHAGYALVSVALWESSLDTLSPSLAARTQAYASAGQALQIDPDNARALIVLSRIQAQDGASQLALSTARQATKAQPDSAEARANLALVLSYGGRTSEARSELEQLRRLDPAPRPEWMLIYGQAAFADERYDAAIADFVSVWPDFPQSALLLEHLAASLALQGRFIQAGEMKDRLLTVMPRANLHLIAQRYATLRHPGQNGHLLDGLRRSGLPEWPYGFSGSEDQRLTGAELASVVTGVGWSGHLGDGSTFTFRSDADGGFTYRSDAVEMTGQQALRDGLLCLVTSVQPAKEDCGPLYRNSDDPTGESPFVFVSAKDVRYFSVTD